MHDEQGEKQTFGPVTLRRVTDESNPLIRTAAEMAARARMRAAADHADRVSGAAGREVWTGLAREFLRDYLLTHKGQRFTCEDVRREARKLRFPTPPDSRAWGAVVQQARREGVIRSAGYRERGNDWGSVCRLWEGVAP